MDRRITLSIDRFAVRTLVRCAWHSDKSGGYVTRPRKRFRCRGASVRMGGVARRQLPLSLTFRVATVARRYCCCFLAGNALQRSLPWGVAGCSSRRPTRFFAPPKKVGQKRRPLRWRSVLRTDCTRRQGLKREASETRCAQTADASLSVSVPGDASPSNGDPRQRQRQTQRQRQMSLRGTSRATATVAARR